MSSGTERCPACGAIHQWTLKQKQDKGARRVYAFDLDGTLCQPADDPQAIVDSELRAAQEPLRDRIEVVKRLKAKGAVILVQTARSPGQYLATKAWLATYDVPCDGLFLGKPDADTYVDDKGINAQDFFAHKTGGH